MINLTEMKAFRHEKLARERKREEQDKGRLPLQWLIRLLLTASSHENLPKYRGTQSTYIWPWACILPEVVDAPPQRRSLKKPAPRLEQTHSQLASPPSFKKTKTRACEFLKEYFSQNYKFSHYLFTICFSNPLLFTWVEIFIGSSSNYGHLCPSGHGK